MSSFVSPPSRHQSVAILAQAVMAGSMVDRTPNSPPAGQLRVQTLQALPASKKAPLKTRVYFHACWDGTGFGETVRVVGGHPSLGAWNPADALSLETNEDIFPCWISTDPISVDLHTQVEYKYIITGNDGQLQAWEDYTGNRKFMASGTEMTVEDDEGLYRQKASQYKRL
mmetsp:Transcript_12771/g.14446  ORF Transcript_12771/g.14446 Transcript_12771/m.14446 type:complete len:170 (+) Transcript_12771:3-512(+)